MRADRAPTGIGSTALSLLGRLLRAGPSTDAELAAQEGLQPQSLTRALQSLEEGGLIERTADAADRRRSIITISEPGIRVLSDFARRREAWLARAMTATLSPTECDMLRIAAGLMERIAEHDD